MISSSKYKNPNNLTKQIFILLIFKEFVLIIDHVKNQVFA